jgi:hypothetical protein
MSRWGGGGVLVGAKRVDRLDATRLLRYRPCIVPR